MDNEIEGIIEKIKKEKDVFAKAKLLHYLTFEKDLKLKDIAPKLGIKPAYICHFLRLNRLPETIIDGYYAKQISVSHLFIISRLKNIQQMNDIYERILIENLTIFETEMHIREIIHQVKTESNYLSKEEKIKFIDYFLKEKNIDVKIIQSRIKSKLIIEIKGSVNETTKKMRELMKRILDHTSFISRKVTVENNPNN